MPSRGNLVDVFRLLKMKSKPCSSRFLPYVLVSVRCDYLSFIQARLALCIFILFASVAAFYHFVLWDYFLASIFPNFVIATAVSLPTKCDFLLCRLSSSAWQP